MDFLLYLSGKLGPLAQLVEQETLNLLVVSSNLTRPTSRIKGISVFYNVIKSFRGYF